VISVTRPFNPRPNHCVLYEHVFVCYHHHSQEADKLIHAPTMTGIMSGAYYLRNSHNASSRTPRQEWDMQLKKPIATAVIEGIDLEISVNVSRCIFHSAITCFQSHITQSNFTSKHSTRDHMLFVATTMHTVTVDLRATNPNSRIVPPKKQSNVNLNCLYRKLLRRCGKGCRCSLSRPTGGEVSYDRSHSP